MKNNEPFDPSRMSVEHRVSIRQIAEFCGLSVGQLYNLRSEGKFIEPVTDTGRSLRFRWGDVLEWERGRTRRK